MGRLSIHLVRWGLTSILHRYRLLGRLTRFETRRAAKPNRPSGSPRLNDFSQRRIFHALQQDSDDSTRLVYADYLEDRGDEALTARGELIRVQIELAAPAPINRRTAELTARQNDLLARWERVWLGEWADVLDGWAFRRGFVEAIRADASVFLDCAADWFAEWPTLTVAKLTRSGSHLPELAESPWLAHLRGLDLSDNGIDSQAALLPDRVAALSPYSKRWT